MSASEFNFDGPVIVVVDGNATFNAGSNSLFKGLLVVRGNLTLRAPVYFRGSVVVTGAVDMAGTGGDYSELNYDAAILREVLTILGQYRFSTATYLPADVLPDGTPDEDDLVYLQNQGKVLPGQAMPATLDDSLPPPGMS